MNSAIVGCGLISKTHAESLIKLGHTIVGLCDIEISKAQALKDKFNLDCPIFEDLDQMLDSITVDVLHICTPHYLHAPMVINGLNRNINVLCEKPMAINMEQAFSIRQAVISSKAKYGVCFQNRFLERSLIIKDKLANQQVTGMLGQVIWSRGKDYYNQGQWRGKWETEGGGVMINQAIHTLDLLVYFGGMPKTVEATCSNFHLKDTIEVEDTATAYFGYSNPNQKSMFMATTAYASNMPITLDIIGSQDHLQILNNQLYINGTLIKTQESNLDTAKKYWGNGHVLLIDNYYNCIKNNIPFSVDWEQAVRPLAILLAMYKSNITKQPINIQEILKEN